MDTTMPTGLKGMQRFLGVTVFFSEYVPNFSSKTSTLYDMIRHDFNWDRKTWVKDYQAEFERVKLALCNSVQKHFTDYALDWIVRVDASQTAAAAVLLQIMPVDGGKDIYHPIGLFSL